MDITTNPGEDFLTSSLTHYAAALQRITGTAAMMLPISNTDRYVVIGTAADIAKLLPIAAPTVHSTTAADLSPNWAGEFETFDDWVRRAQRVLSVPGHHAPAICVDAKGRRCHIGKDMARARDEGAFPVRYFWNCEAGQQVAQGEKGGES